MDKIRDLIRRYPLISTLAVAGATYYGGPQGAELLAKVAKALGLVG